MNNPSHPWAFGVSDLDIKAGALKNDRIDVLVMADSSSAGFYNGPAAAYLLKGGLGDEGTALLRDWVRNGGGLYPIRYFGGDIGISQADTKGLSAPGTILRMVVDNTQPPGYGMRPETPAFFTDGPAYMVDPTKAKSIARFPGDDTRILMSGMMTNGTLLKNKDAVAEATAGNGRIILIGISPIQRGLGGCYLQARV